MYFVKIAYSKLLKICRCYFFWIWNVLFARDYVYNTTIVILFYLHASIIKCVRSKLLLRCVGTMFRSDKIAYNLHTHIKNVGKSIISSNFFSTTLINFYSNIFIYSMNWFDSNDLINCSECLGVYFLASTQTFFIYLSEKRNNLLKMYNFLIVKFW